MFMRARAIAATLAIAIGAALAAQSAAPSLVIVNARVFTGVAAAPWAEALSIVGDHIDAVGRTSDVRSLAGPSTRVIDAQGRVVIPGINDAHVHIGGQPEGTDLGGPPAVQEDPPLDEMLKRLAAAVARAPKGGWIYGEFGGRVLDDARATRFTLDRIAPEHPVMLGAWTGHGTLCNTAALRLLKIRDDEPDPPGGFFVRAAGTSSITGMAHEYAEYILRERLTTTPDEQAQSAALRRYASEAITFGITSAQVMSTSRPSGDLARTARDARMPIRLRVIDFPLGGMAAWRQPASAGSRESGQVTTSGTKWILDGTPVERLMHLREPYADRPSTRGLQNFPQGQIVAFLEQALGHREQPMFHATGDAAIDTVLGALEQTGGARWWALRPRIEHADMLEPAQFERTRHLGVIVVQNPSHFMLPEVMARRLGARTARTTMMKSMLAAGVAVALGSDGPMNPYLNLMFASINANNPAEAMTREQAVSAYTLGSSRAEFQESRKGTLAPGMVADLALLSQDIFTAPPDALPGTSSLLTVVGGRIVHEQK